MILEKDSSVLGYPGEVSKALNADHHGVCKYDSPSDSNYIAVRNALKSIMGKVIMNDISNRADDDQTLSKRRLSQDLRSLLAITDLPSTDYSFFQDRWTDGTCEWILFNDAYLQWTSGDDLSPKILWLYGRPASGKSVLSSFVINKLVALGKMSSCQYFFIRYGDSNKRSLSLLFRSLAYQMALAVPGFQENILELADEAVEFESVDPKFIWECLISTIIRLELQRPIFWVIDGIDEADNGRLLIKYLGELTLVSSPVRVLLVGRNTSEINTAFGKLPTTLCAASLSIEGHESDLRHYVEQELTMRGEPEFISVIVDRVTKSAKSNFLVNTTHALRMFLD